ncbi:GDSL family lipase [Defluviimonas sp. 20V17]|uniref:Acyl-CoA thioesterase-1 n=1 Tax=Allgaiera indica TaxID=765699 RepID=A0AAN4UN99_9RHOB|nr:arylesterase [Allgaiera indica]KDB02488.1 GDSL family lipase [Defluviimonas sp. 20V17]GHD98755.1 arylesterase [Allgaiera indica]SDW06877.1 acyl-CoA thioesterase-1 [Allgaiera indica]
MRGGRKFLAAVVLAFVAAGPVAAGQTVIAFGDSLTQGHGLPQAEGFAPQLQDWLKAHGHDVTVVNAGVSGDTTAGGLARIGWTLGQKADAVIVELGGNDMLRGLPVSEVRKNLNGILQAIRAKGLPVLLIGLKAPANYGPDYEAGFDAVYPDLARKYHALLVPDFFAALKAKGETPAAMQEYMQSDHLHPSAKGVKLIVAAIGPEVEKLLAEAK